MQTIDKEHPLFLTAGFTPANSDFTKEAENYRQAFEEILSKAVSLGDGVVNKEVLESGEIYTPFTVLAERKTEQFNGDMDPQMMGQIEQSWNQIMLEHAIFIRGLLDPTENDLLNTADSFARKYAALLEKSRAVQTRTIAAASLDETRKFQEFKTAGVKGIEECKIRSVILLLLADHVLREANHYIRYWAVNSSQRSIIILRIPT